MSNFVDRFFTADTRSETDNRRTTMRLHLLQFVELKFGEEVFRDAATLDLSVDGMRVQCHHPIELGTSVFIMFTLPNLDGTEREIQGEYTIIHCSPDGQEWILGLRAFSLSEANRAFLEEFIGRRAGG